eukprot:m.216925 g.216925  ORF g.216925 m.216925 type:complete len:285 (-) comp33219_c3_seq1:223-1077(-)
MEPCGNGKRLADAMDGDRASSPDQKRGVDLFQNDADLIGPLSRMRDPPLSSLFHPFIHEAQSKNADGDGIINASANVTKTAPRRAIDFDEITGASVDIRVHKPLHVSRPAQPSHMTSAESKNSSETKDARTIFRYSSRHIVSTDCARLIAAAGGTVSDWPLHEELRNVMKDEIANLMRVIVKTTDSGECVTSRHVLNAMACSVESDGNAAMTTYGLSDSQAVCCDAVTNGLTTKLRSLNTCTCTPIVFGAPFLTSSWHLCCVRNTKPLLHLRLRLRLQRQRQRH